jgi:predicted nucleic acid binding AN1-type Zn finger protein
MRRRLKAPLPPSCVFCKPYGGAWAMAENGGMERCDCPRGRALAAAEKPRKRKHQQAFDYKMVQTGERWAKD